MWYPSVSQDQHERALPNEDMAAGKSDPPTIIRGNVASAEPGSYTKVPVCPAAKTASTVPGSEYWLP